VNDALNPLDQSASPATAAHTAATQNWARNLTVLAQTQPELADEIGSPPQDVEWVFARDGALTARRAGAWLSGCSLPVRAARQMLETLNCQSSIACALAPMHGGEIEVILEKLAPSQGVIVLIPQKDDLRMALACCDFSTDLRRHRLWFAAGLQWEGQLQTLLARQEGMPLPGEFIRTIAVPEELTYQLIDPAQRIISQATAQRTRQIAALTAEHKQPSAPTGRLTVVAPSLFRLWNNAGPVLAEIFAAVFPAQQTDRLDADDPAGSSGLRLAQMAGRCDAVVSADLSRQRLGIVVAATTPVITWLTALPIPPYSEQSPGDGLLLADACWCEAARAAGWPASRLAVAAWPSRSASAAPAAPAKLSLIADMYDLQTPKARLNLSSQHLLWELIRDELVANPAILEGDVERYLDQRRRRLDISQEGFDRDLFVQRLILPAYQQGLARWLKQSGLPFGVYGTGWDQCPEFAGLWGGPVKTRQQFDAAIAASAVLLYAWPESYAHEMDYLGKPVLRPGALSRGSLLRQAADLLSAPPLSAPPCGGSAAFQAQDLAVATVLRLVQGPNAAG
jgi:hypothetical protein